MAFKITKSEIQELEETTRKVNKFAPELKGTSDNSAWGYLANVGAEVEQGTRDEFIGHGIHSKSKTVDNMVFPKKDTANTRAESGNNTSTPSEPTTEGTSTSESDAPSSGSTVTSTKKSDNKKTGTTKFVSSDDSRIGTVDSDGNFYMPDDISGGGISAGAKQHAYRKAYDKAVGAQKWRDEQIEKIKSAEQPQNMTDEEWQKAQQKQIDAINKQADKMRNDWLTMQKDSTKINPGLSDYVLGNPHTTAGVLGGGTLGYLALQLSDSRGQMTNQQLYGQDDLT